MESRYTEVEAEFHKTFAELRKLFTEIELLIEDNNQNIKDCLSLIESLRRVVEPERAPLLKRIILKILNIFK